MDKDLESIFLNALADNQDKLFRICSSYTKDVHDAKDLFQEVLVNIWRALPNFRENASLSTWMYRIALNVSLRHRENLHRDKKRFSRLKSITVEKIDAQDSDNANQRKLVLLRNCVRMLNDVDKAIIILYLEELPYKEISSITGLKENTIAVKVKRIKEKLFNCISKKL
ncbi:MAG: RNA polymerase [Muricauda sp.]|nr:RNA polymerase sigma factor [Allomuricauda sp.]MBC29475.1 RNA polymerase [Allomuricauda sp.]|tara:strand:- start:689 stop:1195 length:507 start_codon:yes stop_codon:yes gene_type:complete